MIKNKKEHTLLKAIKTNYDMLKFAWRQKQGRRYIVVRAVMSVLSALFSAFYAILPGIIVNELLEGRRWNYLIFDVFILSFAIIINFFCEQTVQSVFTQRTE